MKQLSSKELGRRKKTRKAVEDYFGVGVSENDVDRIYQCVFNKKCRYLNEEEFEAARHVRDNLKDKDYVAGF